MNSTAIDLTPARWARVEEIYHACAGMPHGEQASYIARSCADDEALRDYIHALLQVDVATVQDMQETIQHTIVTAMSAAFATEPVQEQQAEGARIGPYRIERLLGQGGMGVVYLADRVDEQFDQRVAIKLGRHKLVDPLTQSRLRSERQILANLDHPNIARLFDGGTTADGVPYLVLEYIAGVRIDTYCDCNRLGVNERLGLFRTICSAVHYAHQNLVIHRDIKASNILVTEDGIPKLLDFGIARLIDTHGVATDGLTREGMVVMTPENASPEQILDKPITTATDTYALGLLLQSLLTGLPTHALTSPSPAEIARIVCHETAKRPSLRLAERLSAARRESNDVVLQELEDIAANRNTTPERLQKRLRGDVDMIVLNALRKEPERRYRSANEMADDVRLHLESKPITAQADSWRYRTGKFVRRHAVGVAMTALLAVMLAVFVVTLSIRNEQIIAERDRAQEISAFLEEIFKSPDPANARGLDITAKDILAAGAKRIGNDLSDRPDTQSALMETIGRVYFSLGEYQPSIDMLERSLELRRALVGDRHPDVARVKNEMADVLIRLAEYDRALVLLDESLEVNRRVKGPTSIEVAENLFNLAELHLANGQLDQAQQYAETSIDIFALSGPSHSIELAEAKNTLSGIHQMRGDLDLTETLLRDAIETVRSNAGVDHPLMPYYLQHLGVLLQAKGDAGGAETTLNQAIEATRRILGENHDHLGGTLVIQGQLLHAKGDLDGAEKALRDALAIHRSSRGAQHPFVGYDLTSLGMVLHDKGELLQAEDVLRQALLIYASSLDENHQYTGSALTQLGAVLNSLGRPEDARVELERALQIRKLGYADDHVMVATTLAEYGDSLVRLGLYDEAEEALNASYRALQNTRDRRLRRVEAALQRLHEASGRQQ